MEKTIKILLEDLKESLNKQTDIVCLWMGQFKSQRCHFSPNWFYRLHTVLIKTLTLILKLMKIKGQEYPQNSEETSQMSWLIVKLLQLKQFKNKAEQKVQNRLVHSQGLPAYQRCTTDQCKQDKLFHTRAGTAYPHGKEVPSLH